MKQPDSSDYTLFQQYAQLAMQDQLCIVHREGTYLLAGQKQLFYDTQLFSLNNFFVEVWYEKNSDQMTMVRAFQELHRLDPFLVRVSLRELLPDR
ncbi:hypothetical protein GGR92_000208 [Spirosoma lacussanchae]|uniref:hypothetical protein n=1 Tax=Spirosoma lacussanchae TaxID=1884249 RepID=UPI001109ACE6|nr:hypothetical protein [Spirosoma lacussanchae]